MEHLWLPLQKFACQAVQKESSALRGTALSTIGQFAEQMDGVLAEYAPEILNNIISLLERPIGELEEGIYFFGLKKL